MKNLLLLLPVYFSLNLQNLSAQENIYAVTDSINYSYYGYPAPVKFTIYNHSNTSIYFPHCGERIVFFIKKKDSGTWVEAGSWGWICLAIYSMGIKEIEKDSIYIDGCFGDVGTYRLQFLYSFDPDPTQYDTLVSNEFTINDIAVGIKTEKPEDNFNFYLSNNYPNPFNPTTNFEFRIADRGSRQIGTSFVSLKVFDVIGNEVATLVNEEMPPGTYKVIFSAEGGSTSGGDAINLSGGIYFYQLKVGSNYIQTKKMILLK